MYMNKTQMVESYAATYEVSKVQAKVEIERVFGFLEGVLATGESVQVTGFGTFSVHEKPESTKRNPQNGAEVIVPKHKVPKFKYGATLKSAVNGGN